MPGVKGLRCQQHTYQEVPGLTQVPAATYEKKGVEDKKSHSSPHRQVTPPPLPPGHELTASSQQVLCGHNPGWDAHLLGREGKAGRPVRGGQAGNWGGFEKLMGREVR